jgi:hypothetical protein
MCAICRNAASAVKMTTTELTMEAAALRRSGEIGMENPQKRQATNANRIHARRNPAA